MAAPNALIADRNLISRVTLETAGWEPNNPASNVKTLPLGIPAISTGPGTAEDPVLLEGVFSERNHLTYVGLFKTNLNQRERIRLELFREDDYTDRIFDTRNAVTGRDRRVVPSILQWRQMRYGAPNWYRGDFRPEDFALYPTNVHFVVPLCRPLSFRISMVGRGYLQTTDPDTNGDPADFIKIGHAWFGDTIEFDYHYPPGATRGIRVGDDIVRVPGGGNFVEPGTAGRKARIPFDFLTRNDSDPLTDTALRVGNSQPVVWIPNSADAAELFRYSFIGQLRGDFDKTQRYEEVDEATVDLEEITT